MSCHDDHYTQATPCESEGEFRDQDESGMREDTDVSWWNSVSNACTTTTHIHSLTHTHTPCQEQDNIDADIQEQSKAIKVNNIINS